MTSIPERRIDDQRIANIEKCVALTEQSVRFIGDTLREMKDNQKELEIMIRDELKNHQEQINDIKKEQITVRTAIKISAVVAAAFGGGVLALSKSILAAIGMLAR